MSECSRMMDWNVPSCNQRRYRSSGRLRAREIGAPRKLPMSSLTYAWPMLPIACDRDASDARVFHVPHVSPVKSSVVRCSAHAPVVYAPARWFCREAPSRENATPRSPVLIIAWACR